MILREALHTVDRRASKFSSRMMDDQNQKYQDRSDSARRSGRSAPLRAAKSSRRNRASQENLPSTVPRSRAIPLSASPVVSLEFTAEEPVVISSPMPCHFRAKFAVAIDSSSPVADFSRKLLPATQRKVDNLKESFIEAVTDKPGDGVIPIRNRNVRNRAMSDLGRQRDATLAHGGGVKPPQSSKTNLSCGRLCRASLYAERALSSPRWGRYRGLLQV
jgi:hypothetical protein